MTDITRVVLAVDSSQVRTATRDLDGMNKTTKATTSTVAGLGKMLAGAFAVAGGAQLARQLYQVNAEAQRLKASLATVTGAMTAGNAAWAELEKFASTTPFSLNQSVEAYVRLQSLGLNPTMEMMRSFGNTASAMGKDMIQFAEAVADASTGEFERLKEFGIKASKEGERVKLTFQGVTTDIGNNAEEITRYLENIGNTTFGDAMELQMDTLGGAMSNLGDNVDGLMRALGESGGNDGLAGAINWVSEQFKGLTELVQGDTSATIAAEIARIQAALDGGAGGSGRSRGPSKDSLKSQLADLKSELVAFKASQGDIGAINARLADLNIQLLQMGNASGGMRRKLEPLRKEIAFLEGVKSDKLAAVNAELDKLFEGSELFSKGQKAAAASVDTLLVAGEQLKNASADWLTRAKKEAAEYADNLQNVLDKLYPQKAAARDLMEEYDVLAAAVGRVDGVTGKALDDWIDRLKVAPDELHRSAEAIDELTEKADPFGKIWDTTIERLQGNIADMFYDMLENGKVTFDSILDLFKRMAAEMAAQKIVMAIGLGGGAAGALAGGGMGGGGGIDLGSIASLFSGDGLSIAALGSAFNTGVVNLAGMFGYGSTISNGILTTAGGMAQVGSSVGLGANTAMLGGTLITAGAGYLGGLGGNALGKSIFNKEAESQWGAAAGATAGAYIGSVVPVIGTAIGALIGGVIGGLVDVASGGDGKERLALGVSTNADWNNIDTIQGNSGLALTAYAKRTGDEGWAAAKDMQQILLATDAALTGFFESLGVTVDLAGQTLAGKASQFGNEADGFFGAAGFNGLDPEDLVGATDDFVRAWVDRANELTKAGLDLTPIYDLQREGELLADVLLRVHSQFSPLNATLDALGVATYELSVQGMAAADGLVAMFGGLENFTSAASRYYDLFYTEQEKLAAVGDKVNDVFAALNLTAPTTLDGFRALVEEYGNMGAAGQETLAALLSVAPAFHQVTTAASAAAAAAQAAAPAVEAISQAMLTLQSQTKALEIELLKAQGLTEAAAAAQYALDTEGLTAAEIAVYEYNQSIIAQIEAINAANAAAEESARLQAAESERAAAEALRIEQQKNAALEAAQQAAAQRAAAIAQERYGLETQLLQLQGNTAELRRRELKELDPSNRALQQQIWALEDQKTAAEAAAQASEQLASTWGNVADNLLAEAKRIRDSAAGDAMSFAGAQAQFAILTAQARAGNMDAAEALPGASQRLLELGMGQARTRADYIRLASATATSLEGTASTITSHDALAKRSAEALEKIQADQRDQLITIQQLTVTTNRLHRIWDDCTQGGTTIRTTETTP